MEHYTNTSPTDPHNVCLKNVLWKIYLLSNMTQKSKQKTI